MKVFYFDESDSYLIIHALEKYLESLKEIQNNKNYKTLSDEAQKYYNHKRLQCDKILNYFREEVDNDRK